MASDSPVVDPDSDAILQFMAGLQQQEQRNAAAMTTTAEQLDSIISSSSSSSSSNNNQQQQHQQQQQQQQQQNLSSADSMAGSISSSASAATSTSTSEMSTPTATRTPPAMSPSSPTLRRGRVQQSFKQQQQQHKGSSSYSFASPIHKHHAVNATGAVVTSLSPQPHTSMQQQPTIPSHPPFTSSKSPPPSRKRLSSSSLRSSSSSFSLSSPVATVTAVNAVNAADTAATHTFPYANSEAESLLTASNSTIDNSDEYTLSAFRKSPLRSCSTSFVPSRASMCSTHSSNHTASGSSSIINNSNSNNHHNNKHHNLQRQGSGSNIIQRSTTSTIANSNNNIPTPTSQLGVSMRSTASRANRIAQEFSQQRLDFTKVRRLVGRDDEVQLLLDAWDECVQVVTQNKKVVGAGVTSNADSNVPVDNNSTIPRSSSTQCLARTPSAQQPLSSVSQRLHRTIPLESPSVAQHNNIINNQPSARHLALISGASGSGKSALMAKLKHPCAAKYGCFVRVKFELRQKGQATDEEPLYGIKNAMIQLCSQLAELPKTNTIQPNDDDNDNIAPPTVHYGTLSRSTHSTQSNNSAASKRKSKDPRSLHELQQNLTKGLSFQELEVLGQVIPNLAAVVGIDTMVKSQESTRKSTRRSSAIVKPDKYSQHLMRMPEEQEMPTILRNTSSNGYRRSSIRFDETISLQAQADRLKFATTKFLEIVNQIIPLAFAFDDAQWANSACLDIMTTWISDRKISSLLMVVSYRSSSSEQPPSDSALSQSLRAIEGSRIDNRIRVSKLETGNLSSSHVNDILVDILDPDNSEITQGLAEIVHGKTGGNIFFLQEFIRSLTRDNLLQYNIGLSKWAWDEAEIQAKSAATSNIVELMQSKLNYLQVAQSILPVAACIGSTFSWFLLEPVLEGFAYDDYHRTFYKDLFKFDPPSIEDTKGHILETCRLEGLIECKRDDPFGAGNEEYRFMHDKVQEVSLSLIDEDRLAELRFRMGIILLEALPIDDVEDFLFIIINLLNSRLDMVPEYCGDTALNKTRLTIASLNHASGVTAIAYSAFKAATGYFENALSLLPEDHWQSQYELSLDIYSSLTECAFVTSNLSEMKRHSAVVIDQDCPMIDKMRVYHVLMSAAAGQASDKRKDSAIDLGFKILAKLGVRLPRMKVSQSIATLSGLAQTRVMATTWAEKANTSLPVSTSRDDMSIMKTLDAMSVASYISKPDLVSLIIFKSIRYTLDHGITVYSPPAFCTLGMILGPIMGDFKNSRHMAKTALEMLSKIESQASECRTLSLCYGSVLHWTQSWESCKEPLLRGYSIGMSMGDVESSFWCILYFLDYAWLTGVNLVALDHDYFTYTRLMKDAGRVNQFQLASMNWQLLLNMRGLSDHETLLVGDAFDEKKALERFHNTNKVLEVNIMRFKLQCAVLFGDMELAASIGMEHHETYMKLSTGMPGCVIVLFSTALSCYAMLAEIQNGDKKAPKSKQKKYLKVAKKCRSRLVGWIKKGNPNCIHLVRMIDGERAASKRSLLNASNFFQLAITVAGRSGLIHDQALANERFAECLLRYGDKDCAKHQFDDAIKLYTEWGARRKVELLEQKYYTIWPITYDAIKLRMQKPKKRHHHHHRRHRENDGKEHEDGEHGHHRHKHRHHRHKHHHHRRHRKHDDDDYEDDHDEDEHNHD